MKTSTFINDKTLQIERLIDAPLDHVWEAWSKVEHISDWWAPEGMQITAKLFDFKPSGQWIFTMPMPDGSEFTSEGSYLEIIPLQKMITTADFKPMTEDVELHISFESVDQKTKFTFQVAHKTAEYCQQQLEKGFEKGWGAAFDRMQDLISKI